MVKEMRDRKEMVGLGFLTFEGLNFNLGKYKRLETRKFLMGKIYICKRLFLTRGIIPFANYIFLGRD